MMVFYDVFSNFACPCRHLEDNSPTVATVIFREKHNFRKSGLHFYSIRGAEIVVFPQVLWKFRVPAWSFRRLWGGLWRVFQPYFQLVCCILGVLMV